MHKKNKYNMKMRKYKPIRIHHIYYGYEYWWGKYFFFSGKSATTFAIVPMPFECHNAVYVSTGRVIGHGDICSWPEQRQNEQRLTEVKKNSLQAIDLGLPSGLMWANMNVGAEKETDYGLYFQWGDTVGYTDASHSTWATCPGNGGYNDYDADSIAE